MCDLLSLSWAGCSYRDVRSTAPTSSVLISGGQGRTARPDASPMARPTGQKLIAAPASALTMRSTLSAAFNDRKLMSRLPAANSPNMSTNPVTGQQQPAIGGVQPAPHGQAGQADQQVHQVVERVELEPEQDLVGPSGEITNAGDHEAKQPDQGVDGTNEQREPLARVASRGDWPSRHDHAPSATTDRYPATPTPPYGPCNRRQGPFVAGGLWPRRSVAALVTVDLAWGGAEHQISLRLRFEVMAPSGEWSGQAEWCASRD
jgi:hypothetical protein